MSRATLVLTVVCLSSLAACGGGSQETVKAPEKAAPTTEAKVEGKPAAEGSAKNDAKAAPKNGNTFVGDDPGKAVALTGEKAWTLGPGDSWDIGLYDYKRADGTKNVFLEFGGEGEFAVPGAFTYPAKPAQGLKKGDPVLVPVVTTTECGRVVSVSGDKVKVSYVWVDQKEEKELDLDEVLPLDGKLGYGAPVAYKEQPDDESWTAGRLVYKDDKTAWLLGNTKVPANSLKPLDVKRIYKVGDDVLALPYNSLGFLSRAKITKVLHDGLEYEFEEEGFPAKVASYCSVTAPIK